MLRKLKLRLIMINMVLVTLVLMVIVHVQFSATRNNIAKESQRVIREDAVNLLGEAPAPPPEMPRNTQQDMAGSVREINGSAKNWTEDIFGEVNKASERHIPCVEILLQKDGTFSWTDHGDYQFTQEDIRYIIDDIAVRNTDSLPEFGDVLADRQLRFIWASGEKQDAIVLVDTSYEKAVLSELLRSSILIALEAFLVFLLISILIATWAAKPVEKAWQQQRQFVADASHELKTPLTVIMTNAELLQNDGCKEEEKSRFSENIMVMSRQMKGLVEELLELARIDNGGAKQSFLALDYSELVRDAILPFEPIFFERQLTFQSDVEEEIWVKGNRAMLLRVTDILLDNAQKYSISEGTVTVSLQKIGHSRCKLTVSNRGEALNQETLKNIFKRFYRADDSRAMNGSYGLGLAIAQEIVERHHGKIYALSENGWNHFVVELKIKK